MMVSRRSKSTSMFDWTAAYNERQKMNAEALKSVGSQLQTSAVTPVENVVPVLKKRDAMVVLLQSGQKIGNVNFPIGSEIGIVNLSPGVRPDDFFRLVSAGQAG